MIFKYKHHFSTFLLLLSVFVIQLLFISDNSSAQSIMWQRVYDGGKNRDDMAYSCCSADGSNIFVVGFAGEPISYFYVLKVNQYGDTLWTKKFGEGGKAFSVASTGDGGCIFTGDYGQTFAIRINSDGDTLWQKFYNGTKGYDIKKTNDGEYVICGEDRAGGNFGSFICKIDSLGNQKWYRNFSSSSAINFVAVEIVAGGYVLCGNKFDTISNAYQATITKTDNNGTEIWSKIYRITPYYSFASKIRTLNLGYLAVGSDNIVPNSDSSRIFLLKLNLNGDSVRTVMLPSNHYESFPIDLLKINDNKYFFSFYHNPNHFTLGETRLKLIDSNLSLIHQSTLRPDTNSIFVTSLMQAPLSVNGDLIVVGGTDHLIFADIDTYIARMDSSITQLPPIGIEILNFNVPLTSRLYQNFPNPFNPSTNIQFSLMLRSYVEVRIFDLLGRELEQLVKSNCNIGTYKIVFDGSKFSNGVYFYQLILNGQISDTKKMILLK